MTERVRLQVPIEQDLLDRVTELAELLGRSQSWLAAELIASSIANRQKLLDWFAWKIGLAIGQPIKIVRKPKGGQKVYLQVLLPKDVAQSLEEMSENLRQNSSSTAAWLIECGVEDEGWLIRAVTSRAGKAVFIPFVRMLERWFGKKKSKERKEFEDEISRAQKAGQL